MKNKGQRLSLMPMTVREAARETGLTPEVIRKAIRGKIKKAPPLHAGRVGSIILISVEELWVWAEISHGAHAISVPSKTRERLHNLFIVASRASELRAETERRIDEIRARLLGTTSPVTPAI